MNQTFRRLSLSAIGVLILLVGVGAGVLFDRGVLLNPPRVSPASNESRPNFALIREAWNMIDRVYVDRQALRSSTLTYGAISGMVDALGDTGHSTFLSPDMVQDERSLTEGEYVGVGLEISMQNNQVVIVAPMDDSPAFSAGLRSGEIILKVDGEDISSLSIQQVVKRIMGPIGTKVALTVFNPVDRTTVDLSLIRARIKLRNLTWQAIPGTNFVDLRIAAFSDGVTRDLRSALEQIQAQKFGGILLDLRDDPGGILSEAIGVASQFLSTGNVLLEKNASGQTTPVAVRSGGLASKIPLVTMIDEGSASAAEIVAGALQDAGRSKLVGEKSFGTGTVLGVFRMSDSSELLLATEEWLTPRGRVIWHQGISPDLSIAFPAGASFVEPDDLKQMNAEQLSRANDPQLLGAIDLLKSEVAGTTSSKNGS